MTILDNIAVWLFVRVIRYWRWRTAKGGARMTILFRPATPVLTHWQEKAGWN